MRLLDEVQSLTARLAIVIGKLDEPTRQALEELRATTDAVLECSDDILPGDQPFAYLSALNQKRVSELLLAYSMSSNGFVDRLAWASLCRCHSQYITSEQVHESYQRLAESKGMDRNGLTAWLFEELGNVSEKEFSKAVHSMRSKHEVILQH